MKVRGWGSVGSSYQDKFAAQLPVLKSGGGREGVWRAPLKTNARLFKLHLGHGERKRSWFTLPFSNIRACKNPQQELLNRIVCSLHCATSFFFLLFCWKHFHRKTILCVMTAFLKKKKMLAVSLHQIQVLSHSSPCSVIGVNWKLCGWEQLCSTKERGGGVGNKKKEEGGRYQTCWNKGPFMLFAMDNPGFTSRVNDWMLTP